MTHRATWSRWATGLAAALGVALAAGCSVAPDNSPRDIEDGALDLNVQDPSNVGQAAAGTGRI
ncbi:MAG: hypothetical protein HZB15_14750 [Actinobacteria bacterium]|nr:hypothetical protein [Actinomycetota bacterium]